MSRIEKMIKELKTQKIREGWKEGKKVAVSFRLDPFTLFCLDEIVKEVGGTRTSNGIEMISEGVLDCLAALGRDFDSLKTEYFAKEGGGIFIDGVKLDPSEIEHLLTHGGDKFGIPNTEMTEEEYEEYKDRQEAEKKQEGK